MSRARLTTFLVVTAVAGAALVAPVTVAQASTSKCPTYEFMGARGSDEDNRVLGNARYEVSNFYGMGKTRVYDVYTRVAAAAKATGVTITPYGVHYPAINVSSPDGATELFHLGVAYDNSVRQGAKDVATEMTREHGACPSTRFILGGYSQGAQAVGDAIESLTPAYKSFVAATVLFGNTEFNGQSSADQSSFDSVLYGFNYPRVPWSEIITSPVYDFCHNGDVFCNVSRKHVVGPLTFYARDFKHIKDIADARHQSITHEHESYQAEGDTGVAAIKLEKQLGLSLPPATTQPSDTVFVIDSTGSMGGEISSVQANVVGLAQAIASKSSSFRFALVDYKDDAANDSPYQSRVDVPFTTNTTTFSTGVNQIIASGGGDTPESMYSGVMTGLGMPWRNGVRKTVIVIGDAPGKDPEPQTGNTLAKVTAKAFAVDPAQVYTVPVGGDASTTAFMKALSDATGGTVTSATTQSDFINSLESAIVQSGTAPVARLTADTAITAGITTTLSAAGTTADPSDSIIGYDWNFGTGTPAGSYDTSTTTPVVPKTYSTPGTYTVSVRARAASGLVGLATSTFTVAAAPTAAPTAPTSLKGTAGNGQVTLTWAKPAGVTADYYVVEDGTGHVIDAFSPATGGQSQMTWTDNELTNGVPKTFKVFAANTAGLSSPAGPITLTPSVSPVSTPPTANPTPTATPTPTVTPAAHVTAWPSDVAAGAVTTLTGTGMPTRTQGTVTLHSTTPTVLEAFTADASGAFRTSVRVPVGTPPGLHDLVVQAGATTVHVPITVTNMEVAAAPNPPGPAGAVAYTGSNPGPIVAAGGALLIIGIAVVLIGRRRRRGTRRTTR